jgi:hypothetical protein
MKPVDFKRVISYFNLNTEEGKDVKVLRDWKFVLIFLTILLVFVLLADWYVLWQVNKVFSSDVDVASFESSVVKKDLMEKVINSIDEKEREFNRNINPLEIKDPSL